MGTKYDEMVDRKEITAEIEGIAQAISNFVENWSNKIPLPVDAEDPTAGIPTNYIAFTCLVSAGQEVGIALSLLRNE